MDLEKIKALFPANRVVALVGFLTAIGAAIVALQTSFIPGSPGAESLAKAAVIIAALVKALGIVLKFMEGSQNWDSLMVAGVPKASGVSASSVPIAEPDLEYDADGEEIPPMPVSSAPVGTEPHPPEDVPEGAVAGKFGEQA